MMTFLPSLMPSIAILMKLRVLVAVADDQAAHLALQRESGEQFRLAADFQAEIERLARVEDFLHHFAELVDLDREHAAIFALVIEFRDGIAKGEVDATRRDAAECPETGSAAEISGRAPWPPRSRR